MRRSAVAALATALGCAAALGAAPAIAATAPAPVVAPPATIDGPSSAIVSLGGLALAQDGGGAVVYTKVVAGVAHIFASLERAGAWQPPVQVDAGVATPPSSQPQVAVADGGRTAVAWVSGGDLYAAVEAAGATAFAAPQAIAPASGQPALGMGISGTAYVAYLGAGFDLDVARLDRTTTAFAVLNGAMSAGPVQLAAAGGGPVITVAADATGVVAWSALQPDGSTHVFVRRVSAAGPSPVLDDATLASLGGLPGGSADSPAVGVAYDSSDAWIAFRESFGGVQRDVVDELLGDELRPNPSFADSLGTAPGASSAAPPSLAINGNYEGLLACGLLPGNALSVATLGFPGAAPGWSGGAVVGAASNPVAPAPATALSADGTGVVAFAPQAGALDAEVLADGAASAPVPMSSATLGPVVPADGLDAAADDYGDLAVAYVAGAPGSLQIAADAIPAPPAAPRAVGSELWTPQRQPTLHWQASSAHWQPPTYAVYVDGHQVATTSSTSYALPAPLPDGRHTWSVVAHDAYGRQAASQTRRLLIDAAPPSLTLRLSGPRRAGAALTFTVLASAVSGISAVAVDYGDGHAGTALRSRHAYARAGSYVVSVAVTDRAGVTGRASERISIR